ncbi:hypothetical protein JG688_00016307 [Phytophthora aleatoria]|uniref:Uncharacterized protein n=1 Tax=Phytophthora aleatoria TaxID=2496075 RepID=A0A8J5IUG5_9STRA|nr:hypothetical protein JG688_00016307 [Phytophthora aleatoria]
MLLDVCVAVAKKTTPVHVRLIRFYLATSKRRDDDRMIGYLKKIVLLQHFGMPFTADATKQNGGTKRGVLTLEMQFLPSEQPKTVSSTSTSQEVYELAIHRVRRNLHDSSTTQRPSGLTKH